jgi:DeoR/GlpR family transcriptional regulator of sugar metabolism
MLFTPNRLLIWLCFLFGVDNFRIRLYNIPINSIDKREGRIIMLAVERRKKIMDLLYENQSVAVPDLSRLFNITEETVRRDLAKLEKEGLLRRTYGGAVLSEGLHLELPISIREVTNKEGKELMGRTAAGLVEDGDTIIMDSSTTVLQMARFLKDKKRLTVITNGLKIASELAPYENISVISTGGMLRSSSLSFVGHSAERAISNYNADIFFMSCKGVSLDKFVTESNEFEAELKKIMIKAAQRIVLLADHTKLDKVSFATICSIKNIDVFITDEKLPKEWETFMKDNDIELLYALKNEETSDYNQNKTDLNVD